VTELREETKECGNYVQLLEVVRAGQEAVTIANVYDQKYRGERPAQKADWERILRKGRVVIAGDMNAHGSLWNPGVRKRSNATFWEDMIRKHELVIWNSEEATRAGPGAKNHSIIDLTLSTAAISLNWSLVDGEATGSDHEVLLWELLGGGEGEPSKVITAWDVSGWVTKGKTGEEQKKAEEKAEEAREMFTHLLGQEEGLNDESTATQVDQAALTLRRAMTETLDRHGKLRRWCTRSKRWWTDELRELRKILGKARRGREWDEVREAKRNQRREIRKAKRKCWNTFLSQAKGNEVWAATRHTSERLDKTGVALREGEGPLLEGHEEREKGILATHFPQSPGDEGEAGEPAGGEAFQRVDEDLVGILLGRAANSSAPGEDKINAGILKIFWRWGQEHIVSLVRACIRLGHHPDIWKTARGVVIPKANKLDYSQIRAYRVISLLDVISKLVERTAAHLMVDHLERSGGLHEGQYGCRKRRATVDAVAVLMNQTEQAWAKKRVAGTLLMDVQAAFNNTNKRLLAARLRELGMEADLVRWTISFMTGRKVKLVLDGVEGEAYKVDTGIPQGSPAAPILFIAYLSGIFEEVERRCEGVKDLSFADDISWWAEGKEDQEVAAKLPKAAEVACGWASRNGVTFDHKKSEAMLFSRKRKEPTGVVKAGGREIQFNKEATRWLGIWLDSHLTLRDHQRVMMKKGRKAMTRL